MTNAPLKQNQNTPPAKTLLAGVMRASDALHGARSGIADSMGAKPTIVGYTGYGSTEWVRILARVVKMTKPRATNGKVRGWRAFTSVPVKNAVVDVEIGGQVHTVHADAGGLIDVQVNVELTPGWHTATLTGKETTGTQSRIWVIDPQTTMGIVSDVDDTVMVTALPRPFLALWNTLVLSERARTPTLGMAVMMDRIMAQHPTIPVVYLSTGAWNVAPALTRFLARNLYPEGPLLLTDWGPSRQHWFRNGQAHKNSNLERLAAEFPHIKWLLIGDDGQHDPAIYEDFARHHPEQTAAVAIRQLSPGEVILAGNHKRLIRNANDSTSLIWVSAPDGAGLEAQLRQNNVI